MHTAPNTPDPAVLMSQLAESEALIGHLRSRTAMLNSEVHKRDERIAELESLIVEQDEAERNAA